VAITSIICRLPQGADVILTVRPFASDGEGIVQFHLRHPPRPLGARLLVAKAPQEQPTALLQHHRQPFDVAGVVIAEDMEEAAVDHVSPKADTLPGGRPVWWLYPLPPGLVHLQFFSVGG
jgi:hypothetical protein